MNRAPVNYHKSRYTDAAAHALCDLAYGWGYYGNPGISKRQQKALELCLRGCYLPEEVVLNTDGCPVVTHFKVISASDPTSTYAVTRPLDEPTYLCTCPDTWELCKHVYGARLLQDGFNLAHLHRTDMEVLGTRILHMQQTHAEFRPHEQTVLQVVLNTTFAYHQVAAIAAPRTAPPVTGE